MAGFVSKQGEMIPVSGLIELMNAFFYHRSMLGNATPHHSRTQHFAATGNKRS